MSDVKWDVSRLSTGERAALRRSAGSLELSVNARQAFYKASNYCEPFEENYRYAALCMDCLWRESDTPVVLPMEECLRRLLSGGEDNGATKSLEHRVQSVLELNWMEDGYLLGKLLNLVRIIKSKTQYKPDFMALTDDLKYWNNTNRFVQKKWIRTIYSKTKITNETCEEEK